MIDVVNTACLFTESCGSQQKATGRGGYCRCSSATTTRGFYKGHVVVNVKELFCVKFHVPTIIT